MEKDADDVNPAEQLLTQFLYIDQTLQEALQQFSFLRQELQLQDTPHHQFFGELKKRFTSWKVTSFLEILTRRLNVKEYASGVSACRECNVFIVGAGPCGLRLAIEAALCGARVVLAEKRDKFTRNNVLHLWPYLIHDLRNLGVKKLFGKFCAGSLDHISIKRLQLILLKIALVLGVEVYTNTAYVEYLEPINGYGWRISVKPSITKIESTDFHVLVGADGKRNSIPGFQRKEFRAKLAIGITANFINNNSDEEAKIEEISGVAALFNQKFFADLKTETDIDLENIVYYKDDTHYFVMTAKKQSLLLKGVLKKDHSDVMDLLSYQNVDIPKLQQFVQQAADFSAGLPHSDLAINPDTGKEDVAIFDFTSMYSAEYAARILERAGKRLIVGLVGDALMEPFWPLGTGCARGFLSCMDLMWMVKQHQLGASPKKLLQERMSLFQILHQTSNENMHKKHSAYTVNPKTRYTFIPDFTEDISHLYEFDEKENKKVRAVDKEAEKPPKKRLAGETTETVHKQWKKNTFARTRKPKNPSTDSILKNKRPLSPGVTDEEMLLEWCRDKLRPILPYLPVTDLDTCWKDGVLLCGLVQLCAPALIDMAAVKSNTAAENVDLAITVMFNELDIQTITSGDVLPPSGPDLLAIISTILELKKAHERINREPISSGVPVEILTKKARTVGKSPEKVKLVSPEPRKITPLTPNSNKLVLNSPVETRKTPVESKKVRKISAEEKRARKVSSEDKRARKISSEDKKAKKVSGEDKKVRKVSGEDKKSRVTSPDREKSAGTPIPNPPPSENKVVMKSPVNREITKSPVNREEVFKSPVNAREPVKSPAEGKKSKFQPYTPSSSEESKKLKLSPPKVETNPFADEPDDEEEEEEDEPPFMTPPPPSQLSAVIKKSQPSPTKTTKVQNDSAHDTMSSMIGDHDLKKSTKSPQNMVDDHPKMTPKSDGGRKLDEDEEMLFHTPEPSVNENIKKRVTSQRKLRKKTESKFIAEVENLETVAKPKGPTPGKGSQKCHTCSQSVLVLKRVAVEGYAFHRKCFVCEDCGVVLKTSTYHLITSNDPNLPGHFYCKTHFNEVLARSREMKGSSSGLVQISRNKESKKKIPRAASVCIYPNDYRREYGSPAPLDNISEVRELSPPRAARGRSKTTPPTPIPPTPTSPTEHTVTRIQTETPRSPSRSTPIYNRKSPTSRTKVTISEVPSPGKVQTRTPSTRGEMMTPSVVTPPVVTPPPPGTMMMEEELPTEGIPDSIAGKVPEREPSRPPPPVDLLPPVVALPKRRSTKAHKAPLPPQRFSDNQSSTVAISRAKSSAADMGTPQALVSKRAMSNVTPNRKDTPKNSSETVEEPKKKISDGVKKSDVSKISDGVKKSDPAAAKPLLNQWIKPKVSPAVAEEFARFHSHSMSDLDSYITDHGRRMRSEMRKDDPEPRMSVQDRIAMYSANESKSAVEGAPARPKPSYVDTDSERKKKVEVSADLKKTVSRDKERVSTARPITSAAQRKVAKRRLLMPSNKHTQRRLAQAQKIQRDRSLLEQKLVEFENEAAEVEQKLRNTGKDDALLSQFLELVNIKNELTRRENEVHLCEKYLQLLDEQDQIERDLRYILEISQVEISEGHKKEEEELILRKVDVVNRRDYLLTQLYDSKRREEEENRLINDMLVSKELSSSRHAYNTDTFITIEELLEPLEDEKEDEIEESLQEFENSTPTCKRREKKGRNEATEENIISKFIRGLNIFS